MPAPRENYATVQPLGLVSNTTMRHGIQNYSPNKAAAAFFKNQLMSGKHG
jgi:hypothetical protein